MSEPRTPGRTGARRVACLSVLGVLLVGCGAPEGGSTSSASASGQQLEPTGGPVDESAVQPAARSEQVAAPSAESSPSESEPAGQSCEQMDRLGALEPGERVVRSVDTRHRPHNFRISCAPEGPVSSEYTARFRVERRSLVGVDVDARGRDAMVAIRRGGCRGEYDVVQCTDRAGDRILARPGTPYVLVVQTRGSLDGPLRAAIDVESTPVRAGSLCSRTVRTCRAGELTLCSPIDGPVARRSCPKGCADDGGACRGNSCEHPMSVGRSGGRVSTADGSFQSEVDALFVPDRDGRSTWQAIETPGEDLVVELTDVARGETLEIRATGDATDHVIAIRSSCGQPGTVRAASDAGDRLRWKAPRAGTYWAIVDRTTQYPGYTELKIRR